MMQVVNEKESVKVLRECMELQIKKGQDYQNPNSNVRQAMHYRRGLDSLHDLIQGKVYRAQSLLEAAASGHTPNHESIEDTYKDIINYASFAVEYLRGKMDGQEPNRDIFNRQSAATVSPTLTSPGPISTTEAKLVTDDSGRYRFWPQEDNGKHL